MSRPLPQPRSHLVLPTEPEPDEATEPWHYQMPLETKVVETAAQKKAKLEALYKGGRINRPPLKDKAD